MKTLSRRDVLRLTTNGLLGLAGLIGLGGLIRYFSYQADPAPQTDFDLGPAKNFPINSSTVISYIPAMVFHDENGFRALNLTCTHLGCTVVQTDSTTFTCPCHSSRYDLDGKVVQGPATRNLAAMRAEVNADGNLHLFTE